MNKKFLHIALVLLLLDQATKYLVRSRLLLGQTIEVLPFFQITYITNTGVAFGLFQGANVFFIFFSIIILVIFFLWYRKNYQQLTKLQQLCIFTIGSGAIGNLLDRIVQGRVIDFLELHLSNYYWPAFNVADSCITVGGVVLFLSFLRKDKNKTTG